jgi:hypothetical protein
VKNPLAGCFASWERATGALLIGGSVDKATGLDAVLTSKILALEIKSRTFIPVPVFCID